MIKEYQVTLLCDNGKYRPVSCIVKIEQSDNTDLTKDKDKKKSIQLTGIKKICCVRRWNNKDLKVNGYTRVKVRAYNKEEIEKTNKERYERIKEEKYSTGEWKRPKKKI